MPDFAKAIARDEARYQAEDNEREDWLNRRRQSIGASEAAMVLEQWDEEDQRFVPMSEYGDAYAVWASKVKGYKIPETEAMRRGSQEEGRAGKRYRAESGRPIGDIGATTILYHPDYPFISATLDRVQADCQQNRAPEDRSGYGVLELKSLSPRWYPLWMKSEREYKWNPLTDRRELCLVPHSEPAEVWRSKPPMQYQIQVQMQMACSGLSWGTLAGFFPGDEMVWVDMIRSPVTIEWAIPKLVSFWDNHVLKKIPPPVRDPRSLDIVKAVFEDDGDTVPLSDGCLDVVNLWNEAKTINKSLENERKIYHANLILALGGATWGALPNGKFLQYKMTRGGYRKLSVVKKRKG